MLRFLSTVHITGGNRWVSLDNYAAVIICVTWPDERPSGLETIAVQQAQPGGLVTKPLAAEWIPLKSMLVTEIGADELDIADEYFAVHADLPDAGEGPQPHVTYYRAGPRYVGEWWFDVESNTDFPVSTRTKHDLVGQPKGVVGPLPRGDNLADMRYLAKRGGVCPYCLAIEDRLVVDHIHPRARGGGDDLQNLQLTCSNCNSMKSKKTEREWLWKLDKKAAERTQGLVGKEAVIRHSLRAKLGAQ